MMKPVGLNLSFRRKKNKLSIAKGHDTSKFLFYLFISLSTCSFGMQATKQFKSTNGQSRESIASGLTVYFEQILTR